MKKNILISSFVGMAFLLAELCSCTDLTEDVYDSLPADNFGVNQTEINALVGNATNTLKRYWPHNFMYMQEEAGSACVTPTREGGDWYDGGQHREMYMHTWNASTQVIKDSWNAASTSIGTINQTLLRVEESTALTEAAKSQTLASLRGLRAFWYYVMVDNWGNVPLYTDYKDKTLKTNTPRQQVFDWIISELNDIAEKCPEASKETYGQFTKGSAYFLLSKLYLNAEAWNVTVSGGNAYELAAANAKKVIDMSAYVLEPDFKTNFGSNDRSREGILTITFSEGNTNDRNQLMLRTLHYQDNLSDGAGYAAWNGICTQPEYVKLFDPADPRYEATFRLGQRYNRVTGEALKTDKGDLLNYTIDIPMIPGTERDGLPWGDVKQYTGARCQKWPYATTVINAMGNHFHIFRLSDAYLTYAEALMRQPNPNTATALEYVNKIRTRAFGGTSHNLPTITLADIQAERRFELAWEAWSRQDDIRFNCYEQSMWAESNCPRTKGDYLKIFPIPRDAWQTNPNLVQNPEYSAFQ